MIYNENTYLSKRRQLASDRCHTLVDVDLQQQTSHFPYGMYQPKSIVKVEDFKFKHRIVVHSNNKYYQLT